jgi:hypothetical protein
MRAKSVSEMQQLGRLMNSLLELSSIEQADADAAIARMTPGVIVVNSLDSLTANFASVIGLDGAMQSASSRALEPVSETGYQSTTMIRRPDASDPNVEQQMVYFKQAYLGFMSSKSVSEMQQLGRVMSVILELSPVEQAVIDDSITRMTPGMLVVNSFDSLTSSFASFIGL